MSIWLCTFFANVVTKFFIKPNTHVLNRFLVIISLFLFTLPGFAQNGLVQNKGQWNPTISYRKTVDGGIVYLKSNSISVLQYNPEQWANLVEHGHQAASLKKFLQSQFSSL
jgi:hypothetical protein